MTVYITLDRGVPMRYDHIHQIAEEEASQVVLRRTDGLMIRFYQDRPVVQLKAYPDDLHTGASHAQYQ